MIFKKNIYGIETDILYFICPLFVFHTPIFINSLMQQIYNVGLEIRKPSMFQPLFPLVVHLITVSNSFYSRNFNSTSISNTFILFDVCVLIYQEFISMMEVHKKIMMEVKMLP